MAKSVTESSLPEKRSKRKKKITPKERCELFRSPNARVDPRGATRQPTAKELEETPVLPRQMYRRIGSILRQRRRAKAQLTIRIDQDVLRWLRSKGPGYQTKLNAMLRELMITDKAS